MTLAEGTGDDDSVQPFDVTHPGVKNKVESVVLRRGSPYLRQEPPRQHPMNVDNFCIHLYLCVSNTRNLLSNMTGNLYVYDQTCLPLRMKREIKIILYTSSRLFYFDHCRILLTRRAVIKVIYQAKHV